MNLLLREMINFYIKIIMNNLRINLNLAKFNFIQIWRILMKKKILKNLRGLKILNSKKKNQLNLKKQF